VVELHTDLPEDLLPDALFGVALGRVARAAGCLRVGDRLAVHPLSMGDQVSCLEHDQERQARSGNPDLVRRGFESEFGTEAMRIDVGVGVDLREHPARELRRPSHQVSVGGELLHEPVHGYRSTVEELTDVTPGAAHTRDLHERDPAAVFTELDGGLGEKGDDPKLALARIMVRADLHPYLIGAETGQGRLDEAVLADRLREIHEHGLTCPFDHPRFDRGERSASFFALSVPAQCLFRWCHRSIAPSC
jgi:hypothetical protein